MNKIERFLSEQELLRLMQVLNAPAEYGIDNLVVVAIVKVLLLTGMRKREVMDMKWADVDLSSGHWKLENNKSGKPRLIRLASESLRKLEKCYHVKVSMFLLTNKWDKHSMIFVNATTKS